MLPVPHSQEDFSQNSDVVVTHQRVQHHTTPVLLSLLKISRFINRNFSELILSPLCSWRKTKAYQRDIGSLKIVGGNSPYSNMCEQQIAQLPDLSVCCRIGGGGRILSNFSLLFRASVYDNVNKMPEPTGRKRGNVTLFLGPSEIHQISTLSWASQELPCPLAFSVVIVIKPHNIVLFL